MGKVVSFSDFKFDTSSGDLLRGGKRLRIPKQTSRLLGIFIERPGTVITRAELQLLLWPEGEFLDHENAINRVITELRAVFRDNSKNPKYIETVHKRGYRFLPEITVVPVAAPTHNPVDEVEDDNATQGFVIAPFAEGTQPAGPSPRSSDPQLLAVPPLAMQKLVTRPASPSGRLLVVGIAFVMVAILTVALYRYRHPAPKAVANIISLGIFPFESDGAGAQEIGESFRLDLADALAQLPVVQIRAMNSLNNIGRDDDAIRSLSEKLHLDMLLLGTFRMQGDLCKVQLELIRGRDSLHLASYQYEGSKNELSSIRNKLQRDVFLSLQGKGKSLQSIHGSTNDPQAYEEYLKGRELARLRDNASLNQALSHYQTAIRRDPRFAQAYAGMATAHLALRYTTVSERQDTAQQLAQQALQLDPQLAEAHAVLGDIAFRSWDFALGERELRRAIELDPHESLYHAWLASSLVGQGRFNEAIAESDRAITDDPLWPTVYSMATFVAYVARDNNRTMALAQKYESLVPDSSYSHNQLAWAYFAIKNYDKALSEWNRMAEIDKDPARIALEERGREAFHRGGIIAYALVRLEAIKQEAPETAHHANDFDPAEWYAFTGQKDQALAVLQRVVADHDAEAVQIAVNPMLENLHGDPRFLVLLHQIGLSLPMLAQR